MIIHCTPSLADKLPEVAATDLKEHSRLGGWHGDLRTVGDRGCALFCHDRTRFSLCLPSIRDDELPEMDQWFRELLFLTLRAQDIAANRLRRLELALGPVRFDRTTDEAVCSNIEELWRELDRARHPSENVMTMHPVATSIRLNNQPAMLHGRWIAPQDEMLKVIESL